MPDTLAALIAKLGDCPKTEHLLKLFEYKRGMAEAHFPCPPLSETPWMDALLELAERCDALSRPEVALRMWKVRAEAAEADLALCFHDKDAAEQRLMQAEAQLLREEQGADEAVKHIMELETEVERLRKQRREGWRQVAAIPVHRLTDDRGVVVEDAIPRVRVLDLLGEVNP